MALNPDSLPYRLLKDLEGVEKISEYGVLFLLFEMGLELSFVRLKVRDGFAHQWVQHVPPTRTLTHACTHSLACLHNLTCMHMHSYRQAPLHPCT